MGLPYRIVHVALTSNEQKQPELLKPNPNGHFPVMIDHDEQLGTPELVFESGVILLYLAYNAGTSILPDPVTRMRTLEFLFFQLGQVV